MMSHHYLATATVSDPASTCDECQSRRDNLRPNQDQDQGESRPRLLGTETLSQDEDQHHTQAHHTIKCETFHFLTSLNILQVMLACAPSQLGGKQLTRNRNQCPKTSRYTSSYMGENFRHNPRTHIFQFENRILYLSSQNV